MAPSVLVRIDRVLGKTKALMAAAALTENAEEAYEKFWKRMEKPFQRTADEDSDAYRAFALAYDNLREERDTMPAIVLDLKDVGYPYPGAIETEYTVLEAEPGHWNAAYQSAFEQLHPSESERAEALAKIQKCEQETDWHPPGLLDNLGDLQQALEKARSFCSDAQERVADEQVGQWSKPDGPKQWAQVFGCSVDTLMRRFTDGTIRHKKLTTKSYRIHVDDLPKS